MRLTTALPHRLILILALAAQLGCAPGTSPGDINGTGARPTKLFVRGQISAAGVNSVTVAGTPFDTASARYEINEREGFMTDIAVGQIVEIEATDQGNGNVADLIRYDAELDGRVDAVDAAAGEFTALGQRIIVEGTTVFSNATLATLMTGDFVEVSGERDAQGLLHAAYVERRPNDAGTFELKGDIANLDSAQQRFTIGSLTVDYSQAQFDPSDLTLSDGLPVEATGTLNGSTLTATRVQRESRSGNLEKDEQVELEGFIASVDSSGEFTLSGVRVQHSNATAFSGGTAQDLAVNARVSVEGSIDAVGILQAQSIEFESTEQRELAIEIEAQVQSVSGDTLTILGLQVRTTAETLIRDDRDGNPDFALTDIQPGDYLEVRAYQDAGQLLAGLVQRDDSEDDISLQATLDATDEAAAMIVVLGVDVDVSNAAFVADDQTISQDAFFGSAAPGDAVDVHGSFDGSLITAHEVELDGN